MEVIRYLRFSSKKQDKGSSLERQDAATTALCERHGWPVTEPLVDKGQSAWKGDHLTVGNLGKLRKRIDLGLVPPGSKILVENIDRLSRQKYVTARRWLEDVTDRDITVYVCRPELVLDKEAMSGANIGPMLQHLIEANRATGEGDRKSGMQLDNIERMLGLMRQGIVATPRAHAWLTGEVGDRGYGQDDERVELVNTIYRLCASGMGYHSICKYLNANYEPWTVQPEDGPARKVQWRIGYVRDILNSPAVEGEYHVRRGDNRQPTGEIIYNLYPRVVEPELVEAARAQIAARRGTGGAKAHEAKNLLTGLIRCKHCGGSVGRQLTGNTSGKRYPYLTCRNSNYGSCDNRKGMRYDLVEQAVLNKLLHLAMDDADFAVVDDIAPLIARVARLNKAVQVKGSELENVLRHLSQRSDSAGLLSMLDKVEGELKALNEELATANGNLDRARGQVSPAEHARRVAEVRALIDSDDAQIRQAARRKIAMSLRELIDSMIYDGKSIRVSAAGGKLMGRINAEGEGSLFDLMKDGRPSDNDLEAYRRRRAVARAAAMAEGRALHII